MVGILVATYGGLAERILNIVELLEGKLEKVETIQLYQENENDDFSRKAEDVITRLDDGDGVLVFVDIVGERLSLGNLVMRYFLKRKNIKTILGVNMAMLVQAVMMREGTSLDELYDICEEAGR